MTCEQSFLIQDYVDKELPLNIQMEIKQHVLECAECLDKVTQIKLLKGFVKEKFSIPTAPSRLAKKISKKIQIQKQKKKQRIWKRNVLLVVSLVLSVTLGIVFINQIMQQNKMDNLTKKIVYEHMTSLVSKAPWHKKILEHKNINKWLSHNFEKTIKAPYLAGLKPRGVRLCEVACYSVAIVFYHNEGQKFSLFIIREKIFSIQDKQIDRSIHKGYSVLCWRRKNATYMLVAEDKVDQLVETIKQS